MWAAIAHLVQRRVSDRKIGDSWFNSRTGTASLCPWERQRLFPVVAKQDTRCGGQARQKTCK